MVNRLGKWNYSVTHARERGFTLFELLTVIAIIAVLITMASAAYSSAQKKARDSRRASDLRAVQNAFEQYYSDNNGAYSCAPGTTYLPAGLPQDPKPVPQPTYKIVCTGTTQYCGCAQLEAGQGGNASSADCAFATNGAYYCVRNLQ